MKVSVVYAEYYYGKGRAKVIDIRDKKINFFGRCKNAKILSCRRLHRTKTNRDEFKREERKEISFD